MKLTQKLDHFTVFKSFPSTSCCSQKIPPNNLAGLMCEVVSGMFSLGGWWGMDWRERLQFKRTSEAQKPAWRSCAGSLMAEMKHSLHCGRLGC